MKHLKRSEKSRGLVAFANNTADVDYKKIAQQTLSVASHVLKLPYTIISNDDSAFTNTRYDIDTEQFTEWRNSDRYRAYELSPYNETLVIDVDYLILDNNLSTIFDTSWDYLLQRNSQSLVQEMPATMGPNSLPYVWATVFAFRKTPRARLFFELVGRIQNNYGYYKALFNIQERNFRNDYAFAVADIILNGYTVGTNSVPGTMLNVDQVIKSVVINQDQVVIKDDNQAYVAPRTNLHLMGKAYLQSEQFAQLIDRLINEPA
jgi:hypothetical protein